MHYFLCFFACVSDLVLRRLLPPGGASALLWRLLRVARGEETGFDIRFLQAPASAAPRPVIACTAHATPARPPPRGPPDRPNRACVHAVATGTPTTWYGRPPSRKVQPKSHQKTVTLLGPPTGQQEYLLANARAAIRSWANVSDSQECKAPSPLPTLPPRDESLANGSFAVCVMALNEGSFIAEFIDFYLMQNAAHVFFYADSGTTDNTKEVLAPYVAAGKVTYHDWPPERGSAMVGCSFQRPTHFAPELVVSNVSLWDMKTSL
eukprot:1809151-Pleurochrysis_carterae.AAC.1